jgi:ABC-type branched-subunit amino acid transport system ATPase component
MDRIRVRPQELEVRGLTVRFGGVTAVDNVSLTVKPGEIVGLIGPNGAGKSTLIDALCGFVSPAAGTVVLGDTDLTRLPPHRRVHAGLVRSWQSSDLFDDLSVLENLQAVVDRTPRARTWIQIMRSRGRSLSAAAEAAVHDLELSGDLDRMPTDLSFSQRRMLSTARAAALNPSVLLLDEPAAGMSDVRRREVATVISRLAREWGMGLLVVDHDMPFVMGLCDRIVVLAVGSKIADGSPSEVRANPAVIAAYLRGERDEPSDEQKRTEGVVAVAEPVRRQERSGDVLLAARNLAVGYYDRPVVRDIDLEVRSGEVIALLGANRAGKTTTMLGLAGAIRPLAGEVYWLGELVKERVPLNKRAEEGLCFLPEERSVFKQLSVLENLRVDRRCDIDRALTLFPELRSLLKRRAGLLSGGEQQMLGLARALARGPKVLLVDEMSLGLAPAIVSRLIDVLRQVSDEEGVAVILVEQHVHQALRIADRVCVIAGGRMTLAGRVDEVGDRVEDAYLADVLGMSP